jgi:hypothetical protein
MIRQRKEPTGHSAHDERSDDDSKWNKPLPLPSQHSPSSSNSNSGGAIVPNSVLIFIVLFFTGAGFLQNHYAESRRHVPQLIDRSHMSADPPPQVRVATPATPTTPERKTIGMTSVTTATANANTAGSLSKASLLTPEQDAALEYDADGRRYHLVFSTDCSPYQHWQSYLVYYTAMKVHQTGFVTRIASGCDEDQAAKMQHWFQTDVAFMSGRFRLQLTPHFSLIKNEKGETVADYKYFNKPFGLLHWLENSPALAYNNETKAFKSGVQDDVVVLIDPDMGLMRPITGDFSNPRETVHSPRRKDIILAEKVGPGKPFAQVYGFGTQWAKLDLEKICGAGSPAITVNAQDGFRHYPAGPPYLGTVNDMHNIALHWTKFAPGVHAQYPHLLAEMFAYSIAAAHLELPHQLIDSLMISKIDVGGEGWPLVDMIPAESVCAFAKEPDHSQYAVPSVVHLCQRYSVGVEWFFSKRKIPSDIYDCAAPLFAEPPDNLAVATNYRWPPGGKKTEMSAQEAVRESFILCFLYSLVNQAATFYKQNACPAQGLNLEKTRNLVEYIAEQKTKPKVDPPPGM